MKSVTSLVLKKRKVTAIVCVFYEKRRLKNYSGQQLDFWDLEQEALKRQLQANHYSTTWLQNWNHNLLWGYFVRNMRQLRKAELLL